MKNNPEQSDTGSRPDGSVPIDLELKNNVKEAMAIPSSHKNPFWELEAVDQDAQKKRKFLGIFKRRALKEDEVKELRTAVAQAPGNTRVKLTKLRKKYPDNGLLLMLSATATYGMVLNSSNKDTSLTGYKMAVKEAATALLSNQISLANIEMFFKIYFSYLDRYKRFQISIYEEMLQEPSLEGFKREFLNAIQIGEQLLSDRESIQKTINILKKRMKSSQHTSIIDFQLILEVTHHIVNGDLTKKNRLGTASETIAYTHAIANAFARIPILFPVVDKILAQLPESHKSFLLRKIAINSTRNFVKFKLAAAEGEKEVMSRIGKTILRENAFAVTKLEGQSLCQPYETDAYFNLAFMAELSHGLYNDTDHQEIVNLAIDAMDTVISHDMSKKHIFTETANRLSHKLGTLKSTTIPAGEAHS
ncbi:hypothetical protein KKI24_05160 [bacterium]|nr:hypothetical protein [bacterium]